jgi:magnesium transporter
MRKIIKTSKVTWIDIRDPDKEDIQYLRENFNFHPLILDELIPPGHRPKVELHEDYLFLILYYPVYSKIKRETRSRELDIIITRNTIITSHYKGIVPLRALFGSCNLYPESKAAYMSEGPGGLLFLILDGLWKSCLLKLNRIDKRLDEIEKDIFQGKEKEMVKEISLVKTDVINFWRIIDPQIETLESLPKEGIMFFGKNFAPHFADVLGSYHQTWHTLQTHKETILALEDTNQSLLSTKTNEIMKVLTIFSAIFLPLTLIASIWGMNVSLPLTNSPLGFGLIVFIMIGLLGSMLFLFRKKKWM